MTAGHGAQAQLVGIRDYLPVRLLLSGHPGAELAIYNRSFAREIGDGQILGHDGARQAHEQRHIAGRELAGIHRADNVGEGPPLGLTEFGGRS